MIYYVRIVLNQGDKTYWKFPKVDKELFKLLISQGNDGCIKTKDKFIKIDKCNINSYV